MNEELEEIYNPTWTDCLKCKMWNLASIKNGYYGGMCEECFNKSFVNVYYGMKENEN